MILKVFKHLNAHLVILEAAMNLQPIPEKVTLDLSSFWPEGVTVETASREMQMNSRGISTMKKGTERGSWITLIKLSRWLSARTGTTVTVDDLLVVQEGKGDD